MFQLVVVSLQLSLIFLILVQRPQEYQGLTNFASQQTFLGSPLSAQRSLQRLTAAMVFLYFFAAGLRITHF